MSTMDEWYVSKTKNQTGQDKYFGKRGAERRRRRREKRKKHELTQSTPLPIN